MLTYLVIHTGTVKRYLHDAARPWAVIRFYGEHAQCIGRYSTCKAAGAARRAAERYENLESINA